MKRILTAAQMKQADRNTIETMVILLKISLICNIEITV